MNGRVVHLQADAHRALQELLPWYAAGALDADERDRVEQHLVGCVPCQTELEFERRLQQRLQALPESDADGAQAVERGLARLHRRIDGAAAGAPARPPRGARWWRWAVAAQLAVIAGLVVLLLAPVERYRGLGTDAVAPGDSHAQVVVRFRPDASERQIRDALTSTARASSTARPPPTPTCSRCPQLRRSVRWRRCVRMPR